MNDTIELWFWMFTDEHGRRRRTPCKLTEEAAKAYRDAERIEGTRVVRHPVGAWSNTAMVGWSGKKDGSRE